MGGVAGDVRQCLADIGGRSRRQSLSVEISIPSDYFQMFGEVAIDAELQTVDALVAIEYGESWILRIIGLRIVDLRSKDRGGGSQFSIEPVRFGAGLIGLRFDRPQIGGFCRQGQCFCRWVERSAVRQIITLLGRWLEYQRRPRTCDVVRMIEIENGAGGPGVLDIVRRKMVKTQTRHEIEIRGDSNGVGRVDGCRMRRRILLRRDGLNAW